MVEKTLRGPSSLVAATTRVWPFTIRSDSWSELYIRCTSSSSNPCSRLRGKRNNKRADGRRRKDLIVRKMKLNFFSLFFVFTRGK